MPWKKLGLGLLSLVLLAVLAFGVAWAVPVLKVNEVQVTGTNHLPEEQVREVVGVEPGENMLRVNVAAAAAAVAEFPWVKSVSVSRAWPDTIAVAVTERSAVLYTREGDQTRLIDESGVPFLIAEPPPETVAVDGAATADPEAMVAVAEVVHSVPTGIRELVGHVEVPDPLEITFHLDDGRTVYWGSAENNHDKALAMETVLGREGQHWNISNPTMVTVK